MSIINYIIMHSFKGFGEIFLTIILAASVHTFLGLLAPAASMFYYYTKIAQDVNEKHEGSWKSYFKSINPMKKYRKNKKSK